MVGISFERTIQYTYTILGSGVGVGAGAVAGVDVVLTPRLFSPSLSRFTKVVVNYKNIS